MYCISTLRWFKFCIMYKHYLLYVLDVLKRAHHNFSKRCWWQRVAQKQTLQQFVSRGSSDHQNIQAPVKVQAHMQTTYLGPMLQYSISTTVAAWLPAKWQLVSPWTSSWYQPEREARLINLIDLQWLENKLSEQLCLSDHISLPKS